MTSTIIFEDAELAPISNLIKSCYGESNWKDYIVFAGGKDNLFNELEKNHINGKSYVIFIDLLPDNYDTIKTCRMLLKILGEQNILVYLLYQLFVPSIMC